MYLTLPYKGISYRRLEVSDILSVWDLIGSLKGDCTIGVNSHNLERAFPGSCKLGIGLGDGTANFISNCKISRDAFSIGSQETLIDFELASILQGKKVSMARNIQEHVVTKG